MFITINPLLLILRPITIIISQLSILGHKLSRSHIPPILLLLLYLLQPLLLLLLTLLLLPMPLQKLLHQRNKLFKVQLLQSTQHILGDDCRTTAFACHVVRARGEVQDENSRGAGDGGQRVFGYVCGFWEDGFEEAADAGCGWFEFNIVVGVSCGAGILGGGGGFGWCRWFAWAWLFCRVCCRCRCRLRLLLCGAFYRGCGAFFVHRGEYYLYWQ
mmetsp:Transcript_22255/g.48345  ORF Transcript_22255/g.48345 Transcript_22255/m.48345 type:complete len:215 (-) Transcript_22255:48-692(-)